MCQNCDATTCLLANAAIKELHANVPTSNATQLYIQAAVWAHCSYHNESFGSPPQN